MKNIHILLTDKPSRFVTSKENKKCYLYSIEEFKNVDKFIEYDSKSWDSKNIYISNDEQPKHNDYYTTDGKEIYYCNTLNPTRNNHYKKIILTTDQDLIKDGVQAIDDEFLEWFVKNPSCEEVEVEWVDFSQTYFIKIQKEEAKQGTMSEAIKQVISNQLKQETLEEVVYKLFSTMPSEISTSTAKSKALELAKWQQEQDKKLYSEEEVIKFAKWCAELKVWDNETYVNNTFEELLQQFKNK